MQPASGTINKKFRVIVWPDYIQGYERKAEVFKPNCCKLK